MEIGSRADINAIMFAQGRSFLDGMADAKLRGDAIWSKESDSCLEDAIPMHHKGWSIAVASESNARYDNIQISTSSGCGVSAIDDIKTILSEDEVAEDPYAALERAMAAVEMFE